MQKETREWMRGRLGEQAVQQAGSGGEKRS